MKTKFPSFRVVLTIIASLIAFCVIALNRGFLAEIVWTNVALVTHHFRLHTIARPFGWISFAIFAVFVGWITWKAIPQIQRLWQWIRLSYLQ